MGLDVPQDMDGSVVSEVFDAESDPAIRSVGFRDPLVPPTGAGDDTQLSAEAEQRLQEIGYLE
jgi:hypothetical protein